MLRLKFVVVLLALVMVRPLYAQNPTPPPVDGEQVGTQGLPPNVCPADYLHTITSGGNTVHGVQARTIVDGFLAGKQSTDAWGSVTVSSLRVLVDRTDFNACTRLTTFITNGARSAPPPRPWVFFTAGGFYFVSQWKEAQPLSNYTTSYGHVMVFDSAFRLLGAYAF